jgi:ankyrin repeat protein
LKEEYLQTTKGVITKTSDFTSGLTQLRFNVADSLVYSPVLAIPCAPVFHPYKPAGVNCDQFPHFALTMKLTESFVPSLPQNILSKLDECEVLSSEISVFFVVQNNPWKGAEQILFRPQPFLHENAPRVMSGYNNKSDDVKVSSCSFGFAEEMKLIQPQKGIQTHQAGGSVVFSPNNVAVNGLEDSNLNHIIYSLVVNEVNGKRNVAVTLHLILRDDTFKKVCSITDCGAEKTAKEVIENLLTIDDDLFFPAGAGAIAINELVKGQRHALAVNYNQYGINDRDISDSLILKRFCDVHGFDFRNLNSPNVHGATLLTYAIDTRNERMVEIALEKGADPTCKDGFEHFPLSVAISKGFITITNLVREKIKQVAFEKLSGFCHKYGFDVNDLNAENAHGVTPLTVAVDHGYIEITGILLKHNIDVNLENSHGNCALKIARLKSNKEIIAMVEQEVEQRSRHSLNMFCCKYGFDVNDLNAENKHGVTPITVAVDHLDIEMTKILLTQKVDVYKRNSHGNCALKIAEVKSNIKLVVILKEFMGNEAHFCVQYGNKLGEADKSHDGLAAVAKSKCLNTL